ncbi:hypothetical protein [Pandoraea faecigallinarum]|uniref:hypothetical protein n=1 Tax=Pandoraea faecigallinarum TaxID=656179 RepID=UPI000A5D6676|nr:hypothetical protein [Pandoraea faecigallinarum]
MQHSTKQRPYQGKPARNVGSAVITSVTRRSPRFIEQSAMASAFAKSVNLTPGK